MAINVGLRMFILNSDGDGFYTLWVYLGSPAAQNCSKIESKSFKMGEKRQIEGIKKS